MRLPTHPIGLTLTLLYIAVCVWAVFAQGLFGESFISIILGLPWSLIFAYFEYGGADKALLYTYVLSPMILNAAILYWIGSRFKRQDPSLPL